MARYRFLFIFMFISNMALSQIYYPYQDIKLEKPSDYTETTPMALSASTFLLGTPFSETDANRYNALKFLTTWVEGTKDYSFYLKGVATDLSEDKNLLSLYIAAMVKYSLENKAASVNPMTVEINACKLLLTYCDDHKNNFKLKKKYHKLLEKNSP